MSRLTVAGCRSAAVLGVLLLLPRPCQPQPAPDPFAALDAVVAEAEAQLRAGELQRAESRYRDALLQGWMLVAAVNAADGRLADARDALMRATASAVDADAAWRSLALVHLQLGEPAPAVTMLSRLAARHASDVGLRQLLTQALVAAGQPEQAVQELEEARAAEPANHELTFLLASGYLRLGRVDAADRLFTEFVRARPLPQADVLVGRAYRDAGEYARARASLRAALAKDPTVRRAHYYLGTIAVLEEGMARIEEAIAAFTRERALAPDDPLVNLRLGMALVEAQRPAEGLPALQAAVGGGPPVADAFHYLGRCLLALDRPAEAVPALRRALELSRGPKPDELRLLGIHYLLAQALRQAGDRDGAAAHFAASEQLSARRAESYRDRLANYLADTEAPTMSLPLPPPPEVALVSALSPEQRASGEQRSRQAVARAALNLGIMQLQAGRHARAAEVLEGAAAADPTFPQVQLSLGVSYFNAGNYEKAAPPLAEAFRVAPDNGGVRRMLAMTRLQTDRPAEAADLLAHDPDRESDPSLQYAYGLALVRADQPQAAEAIFASLMAAHGRTPELSVVLGQAHAQQGDYEAAVTALQQALERKPDVAEANATLGLIYLRQGRLDEAAVVLRRELTHRPADVKAAHTLATVLDLQGQPMEAVTLLRSLLRRRPDFADARYLLGKILLAQGAAAEAAQHLEIAARLAEDDANVHYQLAQAYLKLGRPREAEERFEIYRRIKDKRRSQ